MNFKLYKCNVCGAVILSFDGETNIKCCDSEMVEQVPNSVDASFEKHVPTYVKEGNKIIVEVHHVMEENHYIEWIMALTDTKEYVRYLEPGIEAKVEFDAENIKKLYAYCNKHGLWEKEVE